MSHSLEFLKHVGEARGAQGNFERIRAVSRLWQFLLGMPPEERVQLLVELGLKEGNEIVEAFLSSPGSRAGNLLGRIEQVIKKLDPEHLECIANQSLGKEEAAALLISLGIPVGSAGGRAGSPPVPPVPDSQPATETVGGQDSGAPLEESVNDSEVSSDEPLGEIPKVPLDAGQPFSKTGELPTELESSPTAAAPSKVQPPPAKSAWPLLPWLPAASTPVVSPENKEDDFSNARTAVLKRRRMSASASEKKRYTARTANRECIEALVKELSHTDSMSRRFRHLSGRLKSLQPLDTQDAGRLLQCLPPGWMRRRVLSNLLRQALIKEKTPGIIPLIKESCVGPFDYEWCCSALLSTANLEPSDQELLLDQAPTQQIRERLERRLRQARPVS